MDMDMKEQVRQMKELIQQKKEEKEKRRSRKSQGHRHHSESSSSGGTDQSPSRSIPHHHSSSKSLHGHHHSNHRSSHSHHRSSHSHHSHTPSHHDKPQPHSSGSANMRPQSNPRAVVSNGPHRPMVYGARRPARSTAMSVFFVLLIVLIIAGGIVLGVLTMVVDKGNKTTVPIPDICPGKIPPTVYSATEMGANFCRDCVIYANLDITVGCNDKCCNLYYPDTSSVMFIKCSLACVNGPRATIK